MGGGGGGGGGGDLPSLFPEFGGQVAHLGEPPPRSIKEVPLAMW